MKNPAVQWTQDRNDSSIERKGSYGTPQDHAIQQIATYLIPSF